MSTDKSMPGVAVNRLAPPAGWRVSAHQDVRGARQWSYVLDIPGEWPYVSAYRYRTEAGALAAGRADAESCAALIAEGITP